MKIAVIIPVYNVAPYLRRCLDSVIAAAREVEKSGGQRTTPVRVEVICVDDGSSDGSGEILDAYASSLVPRPPSLRILHQANGGLSAARNAALDLLERENAVTHVTFVDSDDWVDARYLEELIRGILAGAEIASLRFYRTAGAELPPPGTVDWRTMPPREAWILPGANQAAACAKLYRLSLFDGIRYPVGKINEDELTTYRVFFRADRVACTDGALYAYCARPDSIMHAPWSPRRLDRIEAWQAQMSFFEEKGFPELVDNSRKGLVVDLVDGIRNLRQLGDRELAERYRCELARQLKEGRLPFAENYLAYKTAYPLRTRFMKYLGKA